MLFDTTEQSPIGSSRYGSTHWSSSIPRINNTDVMSWLDWNEYALTIICEKAISEAQSWMNACTIREHKTQQESEQPTNDRVHIHNTAKSTMYYLSTNIHEPKQIIRKLKDSISECTISRVTTHSPLVWLPWLHSGLFALTTQWLGKSIYVNRCTPSVLFELIN